MQRVARRTRQREVEEEEEEEELSVEDVVEEVSPIPAQHVQPTAAQHVQPAAQQVFAAAPQDTEPLFIEDNVTASPSPIANQCAPTDELSETATAEGNTDDNPISLVFANNTNPFIEDIPSPIPYTQDHIQQEVNMREPPVEEAEPQVEEAEPQVEEAEQQVEEEEVVEEAAEQVEEVEEAEPQVEEEEELEEAEPQVEELENEVIEGTVEEEEEVSDKTIEEESVRAPVFDEHGNKLDENGHPMLDYSFPDSWVLQPDQGDGIIRFETEGGPVRFIMELGYNYPDPPNEYKLERDCYLKHIPTTHRLASGCQFFVDNGIWRVQLETDILNVLLRMDIAQDFEDITGEALWDTSKDVTLDNITRAMTIFKDSEMDDSPVRWILAKDAHYNPKENVFKLKLESAYENTTRNVFIHDGMTLVKTTTSVDIPKPHDTEFRDHSTFTIAEDSEFSDKNAGNEHLDSGGCEVVYSTNSFLLVEDSTLEEQGTRHLLVEDSLLEDQGSRHLIYEDSSVLDIVREHDLAGDAELEDIVQGYAIVDDADRVDVKQHRQSEQEVLRTPNVWDLATFEGEVVDMKDMRLEMDMKYVPSPSKFKLNQIELDDDFFEALEDDDE